MAIPKERFDHTDLVSPIYSVLQISDSFFLEFSKSMSIEDIYAYSNDSDSDDDILLLMMLELDNKKTSVHSRNQHNFYKDWANHTLSLLSPLQQRKGELWQRSQSFSIKAR